MISRHRKLSVARALLVALTLLTFTLPMQNCSDVRLAKVPTNDLSSMAKKVNEICTVPPTPERRLTKIMFMVDMSGSNLIGNVGSPLPSDPDKSYRFATIKNFVDVHKDNPDITYGLIVFKGASAQALTNGANSQPAFTDALQMYDALDRFMELKDEDLTPYKAAIKLAKETISADRTIVERSSSKVFYGTVLISDGVPTDYNGPNGIDDSAINADVEQLIVLGGDATLSTVYYGPNETPADTDAINRLKRMAAVGNGNFVDTNVLGRHLPMDNIIAFTEHEPWQIKQFFVANLNASPCDDGSVDSDSDADGICDKDELAYNDTLGPKLNGFKFNPARRNSFGNIFNDYINYRGIKFGEQLDLTCQSATSSSADIINDCEKGFIKNLNPSGPTPDWTSRMGLNGDPFNFDSDGDGFTDGLELLFTRQRSSALSFGSVDSSVDGYSMKRILLEHRHYAHPDNAVPYDGKLAFSRINDQGQYCYTYDQKTLPLVKTLALSPLNTPGLPQLAHESDENVILIYFIQTPEIDPLSSGELHYSYQKFTRGNASVSLDLDSSKYNVYQPKRARVAPTNAGP